MRAIYYGINKMTKNIGKIIGGDGSAWVRKNLGRTYIDLGGGFSGAINANYVDNSTIHVLNGFEYLGSGNYIEENIETMIIHELGHVWDNKMKGTFGSFQAIWSGGGPSDELMKLIGGSSTGIVRWENYSLYVDFQYKYSNNKGYWYGNNSTVDYFAHAFASVTYFPNSPNTPEIACVWVSALIFLTR